MIITYEQAKKEGTTPRSLRDIAQWHKNAASQKKGIEKDDHFRIAAELNRLANRLEEER